MHVALPNLHEWVVLGGSIGCQTQSVVYFLLRHNHSSGGWCVVISLVGMLACGQVVYMIKLQCNHLFLKAPGNPYKQTLTFIPLYSFLKTEAYSVYICLSWLLPLPLINTLMTIVNETFLFITYISLDQTMSLLSLGASL